jgi:hypothetical protein
MDRMEEIEVVILRDTGGSYLVRLPEEDDDDAQWVDYAQVDVISGPDLLGNTTVEIPVWLAQRLGWW